MCMQPLSFTSACAAAASTAALAMETVISPQATVKVKSNFIQSLLKKQNKYFQPRQPCKLARFAACQPTVFQRNCRSYG